MASAINPDAAALRTFVGDTLRIFRTLSPRTAKPCGFFFALAAILGVYRNTLSPLIQKTETGLPELLGRDRIKVAAALETLRCGLADAPG